MNTILAHAWEVVARLSMSRLVVREMAVLLILAASLLVFRTLRERCLMVWIVGWIAYFVSNHTLGTSSASALAPAVSQAEFILAVSLFVAGTLIYSNARDLLAPLLAICLAVVVFAVLRAIYWTDSVPLRFALELSYRLIALAGTV